MKRFGRSVSERVALIAAIGAVAQAAIAGGFALANNPTYSPARSQASPSMADPCAAIIDHVMKLDREYPRLEQLYAQNAKNLPMLATTEEIQLCHGDPAKLLIELGKTRK